MELYNNIIDWSIINKKEKDYVLEVSPGYFSVIVSKCNVEKKALSYLEFVNYCADNNIKIIYAQALSKISKSDFDIYNVVDFSNYNSDSFLRYLKDNNVDYIDLRDELDSDNTNLHDYFYNTDHHWKAETGLLVTRILVDKIKLHVDSSVLDYKNFSFKVYDNWSFGSIGKKVSVEKVKPEDFTLIYPKFNTNYSYNIPSEKN